MYEAWARELPANDPDRDFILHGVRDGFHLVDQVAPQSDSPVFVHNYKSATSRQSRAKVEAQISSEIQNGRYEIVPKQAHITSALGAIPKSNGKVRLIHDCSRPHGHSLNDLASPAPFSYKQINDAVKLLQPGYFLAKVDLASAYRSVKTHPSQHKLTGLQWTFDGHHSPTFMVDKRLPFGARASPKIFDTLSQAVCRIMAANGYPDIVSYLDDYLVIAPSLSKANLVLRELMALLRRLGFAINYDKVVTPSRRLTFLGIVLDTNNMTLELPAARLTELQRLLEKIDKQKKVSKRTLASLAGKLSWATQVIYGGRFHLRRIWDALQLLKAPSHHTRVTVEVKKDIRWWLDFMAVFNGHTPMLDNRPSTPVWLDACNVSAGAVYGNEFVYTPFAAWPGSENLHINFKETLALETAAAKWAPAWKNTQVIVHSDNQAAVGILNRGSSANPFVMDSLRRLFWLSAVHNFRIKAIYLPGHANALADAISRLHDPSVIAKLPVQAIPNHPFPPAPLPPHAIANSPVLQDPPQWTDKLPLIAKSPSIDHKHFPLTQPAPIAPRWRPTLNFVNPWVTVPCPHPLPPYAAMQPC